MRNYDLTLILSPLLSKEEANDLFQKIVSFVQEQGGILGNHTILGKRSLLARIGGFREGFLAAISFSLHEDKLEHIEKRCKEERPGVLRYILLLQPKKRAAKAKTSTLAAARGLAQPTPERQSADAALAAMDAPRAPVKKEEKINLKDIDQKLEEIIGTSS